MNRLYIIDFIRGCAIIMMIIFHIFLSFNLFSNKNYNLYNGILNYLGLISRNLFIFISGISLFLSYKNYKKKQFNNKHFNRLIILLICALIITILTYIVMPDKYIIFGILHYMFLSFLIIIIYLNIFDIKYIYIFFGLTLLFNNLKYVVYNNNTILNYILHILGFNPYYKNTIDYFPLKKWLWKSILGLIIAKNIDLKKIQNLIPNSFNLDKNIITKLGKNSLFIYMFHIPILYLINKL